MSRFSEVFGNEKAFLAVIHMKDREQVLENVKIARTEGADGVFLINHAGHTRSYSPTDHLLEVYTEVRAKYPKFWIGLNFLDRLAWSAVETFHTTANGLWVDDANVSNDIQVEVENTPDSIARRLARRREFTGWSGLYFGGVAFKGQKPVEDLALAVRLAMVYDIDVIATSGDATGIPPSLEKMKAMHGAAKGHPVGIFSGMTPKNVGDYLPYADCFGVASGIGKSFYELDADKVHAFRRAISK